jgi:ABC-type Fe3+-siderophore transport system permease subunit
LPVALAAVLAFAVFSRSWARYSYDGPQSDVGRLCAIAPCSFGMEGRTPLVSGLRGYEHPAGAVLVIGLVMMCLYATRLRRRPAWEPAVTIVLVGIAGLLAFRAETVLMEARAQIAAGHLTGQINDDVSTPDGLAAEP